MADRQTMLNELRRLTQELYIQCIGSLTAAEASELRTKATRTAHLLGELFPQPPLPNSESCPPGDTARPGNLPHDPSAEDWGVKPSVGAGAMSGGDVQSWHEPYGGVDGAVVK